MGRSLITTPLIVDVDLIGTMRSGRFRFPRMRKIVIAIADGLLREGPSTSSHWKATPGIPSCCARGLTYSSSLPFTRVRKRRMVSVWRTSFGLRTSNARADGRVCAVIPRNRMIFSCLIFWSVASAPPFGFDAARFALSLSE